MQNYESDSSFSFSEDEDNYNPENDDKVMTTKTRPTFIFLNAE